MIHRLVMPRIDPNVDEGTIAEWLVQPGQQVGAGQPVVEIITDKATFELETEDGGILRCHCVTPRSVVPVGYVLALVSDDADEPVPDVAEENRAVLDAYREALLGAAEPTAEPSADDRREHEGARGGLQATPSARRLAAREGVDLEALAKRNGGVIRRRDVEDEIRRRKGDGRE